MKIVAFLQNQWFKDPERWRARMEGPQRESCIRILLFYKCLTGQRLRQAFGKRCEEIVWEEVSRQIGGVSGACFPLDPVHVRDVLTRHQPDMVLLFGSVARGAAPLCSCRPIVGPHPAARHATVREDLGRMSETLTRFLEQKQNAAYGPNNRSDLPEARPQMGGDLFPPL